MSPTSPTVHEAHADRMARVHALRPSDARDCPQVVAGKRCRCAEGWDVGRAPCPCQRYYPQLLDHCRIWLDAEGRHVLTAEPYSVDGDELADFLADMAALGLRVRISGRSQWHPTTVLIIVTRADSDEQRAAA